VVFYVVHAKELTSLEFSQLWDICHLVRTVAENFVMICYQEMTSEDIEDFMCAAVTPARLLVTCSYHL
jgi:hypothetical protein